MLHQHFKFQKYLMQTIPETLGNSVIIQVLLGLRVQISKVN